MTKENKKKENRKKENREKRKVHYLSYCLDEEEMERKKMKKFSFSCLIGEKSKKKENVFILNYFFILYNII